MGSFWYGCTRAAATTTLLTTSLSSSDDTEEVSDDWESIFKRVRNVANVVMVGSSM